LRPSHRRDLGIKTQRIAAFADQPGPINATTVSGVIQAASTDTGRFGTAQILA
jgi:hypothetical protein